MPTLVEQLNSPKVDAQFISFLDYVKMKQDQNERFPYPVHISFEPLLEELEIAAKDCHNVKGLLAREGLKLFGTSDALKQTPFTADISDYQAALASILDGLFPSLVAEKKYGYIAVPFQMDTLYITPDMLELIDTPQNEIRMNIGGGQLSSKMLYDACSMILNKYYDCDVEPVLPSTLTFRSKENLLETHFQINLVTDFLQVKNTQPLPKLSRSDIQKLLLNPYQSALWLEYLPVDHFEFYGMVFCYITDITEEQIVAELKEIMLSNNSNSVQHDIARTTAKIRSLFRNENISLGIFMQDMDMVRMMKGMLNHAPSLLGQEAYELRKEGIKSSIYELANQNENGLIVEDLKQLEHKTSLEKQLLAQGYRSLILIPTDNREQILEIGSPYPNCFGYNSLTKIKKYLSIMEAGIERKKDALETQINQVIQHHFTNIHASVDWKFQAVAAEFLQNSRFRRETNAQISPITFERVYPLYGQADIVGSSTHRNKAIQADLELNLQLLEEVLSQLVNLSYHSLTDYYRTTIKRAQDEIKKRFSPTDETRILELLNTEIHPFLRSIQDQHSKEIIEYYFAKLNPALGIIYQARKDFEDSVSLINSKLSALIQNENEHLQSKLPHYFEKYETDGVEYNIYLGQSMLKAHKFSPYYLKDFRLWQLICMCKVTQKVAAIQPDLPTPLTTAQLIFVYSDPLDIKFRMDEKHFDVDGAYNVRYEIIKKRIDKAYILGTDERLTQAGKIAIVYLHKKDRQEYMEYLNYLIDRGWISPAVEDLELGKLQGVEGLKALRVGCL
ncbi:MAG: hypothetical protein AAF849_00865 [Bacteroidota bacterium]